MIWILMGPPGAGKGTQGSRLVELLGVPKISTGAIFRDLAASGSEVGSKAREYWSSGLLVPDDVVVALVKERISHSDCNGGFLLDGFPRTVRQAEILDEMLRDKDQPLTGVLNFAADDSVLVPRLSGRRTCANCGATYHLTALPPRVADRCDHCRAELSQRTDDEPERIRRRLVEYGDKTAPLLDFYRSRGKLFEVNAADDPEKIADTVKSIVTSGRMAVNSVSACV